MPRIRLRFYAELNDFLPRASRGTTIECEAPPRAPLRDLIEGLGVPHTEVELVLVNGESVSLEHVPAANALVSVYPVFEAIDVAGVSRVRSEPLREVRFALDGHLGRLGAYLRMAGFDTRYENRADDAALAEVSRRERRILLTRDQGLLKRRVVAHGCFVRATAPRDQLVEVVRRFDLARLVRPFTRCLRCNTVLTPAAAETVERRVPPRVRAKRHEYSHCAACDRVFWKGTHYDRMQHLLAEAASRPTRLDDIDWAAWSPRDVATLVFVRRGTDLLLIRKKRGLGAGKINGPGGRLDPGETPLACARRELREELLVEGPDLHPHGELRFQFVDGYSIHVHIFLGEQVVGTPTETPEALPIWVPVDAIPYDEMWADDRVWLPLVLAGRTVEGWFLFDGDRMLDHRVEAR
jgi:hypothetical protein